MLLHVLGLEDVVNEHQAPDDLADGSSLVCVRDSGMLSTSGMKSQEVVVLRKDYPSLVSRSLQMLLVRSSKQVRLLYGEHVDAALLQAMDNRPGNMLVRVEPNAN